MEKVESFTVDHRKLKEGLYVAKIDDVGSDKVTTYDIRVVAPNSLCMRPELAHTIEHIGALYLRTYSKYKEDVLYFGPMGCLTGFYLLMKGKVLDREGRYRDWETDRKSTRLNSSHITRSRMPSSA